MKKVLSLFLPSLIVTLALIGLSFSAFADESLIPEWIKNSAKWWSEDKISESEYVSSLQFLINKGILQIPIPINEVVATSTRLSEDERAQHFVVHFKGGFLTDTFTVDTFSKYSIVSTSRNDLNPKFANIYEIGQPAEFLLEGLPNKEFSRAYDTINQWIKGSSSVVVEPFDVDVDVVAGDGTIIQRWVYNNCEIIGYGTYLQDIKNLYSFTDNEQSEIRERIIFSCNVPNLILP